jgi:hypothetical protein
MDKFELLACDTFLSEYDQNHSSIEEVVQDPNTIVWEPFEGHKLEILIQAISNLAERMRNL